MALINFEDYLNKGSFDVDYTINDEGKITAVSCKDWPFVICRDNEETETGLVCKETGEPFGILESNQFNTVLMCWMLIDDPGLIKLAASNE